MDHLAGFDWQTFARMMSYPGIDPRCWVSTAIVDVDTPQARSVQFDDEEGQPLPHPIVNVTMQPSGTPVSARVLSSVSGAGVGEWHPFVGGDEVLVAVPSGDEAAGVIIMGRLSNALDRHPRNVAGNDTTQNSLGFKRFVEPYVLESATSILLRVAKTNTFLSLDPTGAATLKSGAGHYLALHDDLVGLQTADTSCLVQIDPAKQTVFLQAKGTQLSLDDEGSHLLSPGPMNVTVSGGGYAPGHAVTTEQVVTILNAFGLAAAAASTTPLTLVAFFASLTTPATLAAIVAAAATPAASIAGPIAAAITLALKVPPDPSGADTGIGRPGFTY